MSGPNLERRRLKCLRRSPVGSQAGQSSVELALLVPLLTLLLVGGVDVGRLFYLNIELNSAARAGVEYGAQNSGTALDNAGMVSASKKDANDVTTNFWGTSTSFSATAKHFCQCADGTASDCTGGTCTAAGPQFTFVQVDTSAKFNALTKIPGIPSSLTLKGSAVMRVESNG